MNEYLKNQYAQALQTLGTVTLQYAHNMTNANYQAMLAAQNALWQAATDIKNENEYQDYLADIAEPEFPCGEFPFKG